MRKGLVPAIEDDRTFIRRMEIFASTALPFVVWTFSHGQFIVSWNHEHPNHPKPKLIPLYMQNTFSTIFPPLLIRNTFSTENLIFTNNFSHLIQSFFFSFVPQLSRRTPVPCSECHHFLMLKFRYLSSTLYILVRIQKKKKTQNLYIQRFGIEAQRESDLYVHISESYKTIQLPIFATENIFSKHCWYIVLCFELVLYHDKIW